MEPEIIEPDQRNIRLYGSLFSIDTEAVDSNSSTPNVTKMKKTYQSINKINQ